MYKQRVQTQSPMHANHPLPDDAAPVWFTDPPYYDAMPYSDLSDFFFVWLKRILPDIRCCSDPFDPHNPLSPKDAETVQDETKKVRWPTQGPGVLRESDGKALRRGPSGDCGKTASVRSCSPTRRRKGGKHCSPA